MNPAQLAALKPNEYTAEVKLRLANDSAWGELLVPQLLERTRSTLLHMMNSMNEQEERITAAGTATPKWLASLNGLRRLVAARLSQLDPAPVSGNREAKGWRAFSAQLVMALEENDRDALDRLRTPYGDTAREWLAKREEKVAS